LDSDKCHEHSFPLLSKVAEVYVGMSTSSVPVECMFSTTGLISNGKQSIIGPEKIHAARSTGDYYTVAIIVR